VLTPAGWFALTRLRRMIVVAMQYEIRVRGTVGPALLESFERLDSQVEASETRLRGPVEDQAELHGILHRIEAVGLELIEVRRLAD
jgi:hypothetical protein